MSRGQLIDLTGKEFGRLKVVCRAPNYNAKTYWHCQCSCGEETNVWSPALTQGKTRSCGCLHREIVSTKMTKDLTGQRFGRLIVVCKNGHHPVRKLSIVWQCQCDCGNFKNVTTQELKKGDTRSCGCLFDEIGFEPDRYKALIRYACKAQVYRGKEKGLGFNLFTEEIEQLILGPCIYCGAKDSLLKTDYDRNSKRLISNTILRYNGIDRIDSVLGYLRGNVVSCCAQCNRMKSDLSQVEFKTKIAQIYHHYCPNV